MGENTNGHLGHGTTNNAHLPERIVPPRELVITNLSLAGTNMVLQGINDFFGGPVFVLMSTDPALPLNQWTPIWTTGIGNGSFIFASINTVSSNARKQFYALELFQVNCRAFKSP